MRDIYLFAFRGIPVSFNPMFLLLILILSVGMGGVMESVLFGLCAVAALLVHEFGHALTASHYGLMPQITLTALGGVTRYGGRSPGFRQSFLITLAGPCTGLILGAAFCALFHLIVRLGLGVPYPVMVFMYYMYTVNLFWSVFNLIPVYPLDGHHVLEYILARFMRPARVGVVLAVVGFLMAVLMAVWAIWMRQLFMIMIAVYFVFLNVNPFLDVVRSGRGAKKKKMEIVGVKAEALYEKGIVAARGHNWEGLESAGRGMLFAAESGEQMARAYELLTIACTNLGRYEEALSYSSKARQTEPVIQAAKRCKSMI